MNERGMMFENYKNLINTDSNIKSISLFPT